MRSVSKLFWYLSISLAASLTAWVLLAFPPGANAQNGITSLPDLNGDGKADLLWQNPSNGQTVAWIMDGTSATGSSALLAVSDWKVIKTADLNGDGNTDLIVYNASTGQTVAWIMDGTTVTSWTLLLTAPDWKVTEAADFNGDGKFDLLWYNASTGQTVAWLMNGVTTTSWAVLLTDGDWKVVATADLNADGKSDLIWYNPSLGQTAAWLVNGTSTLSWTVLLSSPDWKISATADFNGDGKSDLLWYNASAGQTAMWLMNGFNTVSWTVLPSDSNWKVAAVADLDGDGKSDIVMGNDATGQKIAWLMNGSSVIGSGTLLTSLNWSLVSADDLNNDDRADLLWYNATTGQTAVWLMSGTSPIGGANLFTDPNWKLRCIQGKTITTSLACSDAVVSPASGTMPANQAPIVNAGADLTITLPETANLAGNASDDGAPIALLISNWSQLSGPGSVTFGNVSSLQTSAAFSVAGTYTLRLTVNDSAFLTTDDVVVVVGAVGTAPTNHAPVVQAGPDQTVALSTGANLLGSVSDDGLPTGSTVGKLWSKVSGPAGAMVFSSESSVTTTATFPAAGTYVLRLTANDSQLSASDDVTIVVNATPNLAPVVNAGSDQMVTLPTAATLEGSATDDGLPSGGSLTRTWSKFSGPGTVSFGNALSANTTATFSTSGSYTLRLTASDGQLSTIDDVIIIVSPVPANQAPFVNAGSDSTLVLPAGITLGGNATDDGFPTGSTLAYTWSKVSGPGIVGFVNATSLNTIATFSLAGAYTLRLTVSDGALSSSDDVTIITSGSAGQIIAASCSRIDVQAAINAVPVGGIVNVPAGTCSWSGGLTISGIRLVGAGKSGSGTVITAGQVLLVKHSTQLTRLSGFRFTGSDQHVRADGTPSGKPYVIDNNYLSTSGGSMVDLDANGGLLHHNDFAAVSPTNADVFSIATLENWSLAPTFGTDDTTGERNIYFEDNTFTNILETAPDGDMGARLVIRNNTFFDSSIVFHGGSPSDSSPQGGIRQFEVYNNTFDRVSNSVAINKWIWVRGSTGVIANNIMEKADSPDGSSFVNKDEIRLTLACPSAYPIQYQVGQSNQIRESTPSRPLLIFGNSGAGSVDGNFISVGSSNTAGGTCSTPSNYIRVGRDYNLSNTWGWTPYTYPHPLQSLQ